jgi:hypothetical protein
MKTRVFGSICVGVMTVILTLGLWPFRTPANDVRWLKHRSGLSFGPNSVMMSSSVLNTNRGRQLGGSVEIWLEPATIWDRSSTLLSFWDSGTPPKLSFRQSQTDVALQTTNAEFIVDRVFRKNTPVFLTITAGADGTAVYVDGGFIGHASTLRLSAADFTGRFVIGNSPGQETSWQGQLYGLAIYETALNSTEVGHNYVAWLQSGRPDPFNAAHASAVYLLNERSGATAHNASAFGPHLLIPARYTIADKTFLNPFWNEFQLSRSYWSSVVKNIIGFIPLGLCFYPWFRALGVTRTTIATVAVGTATSLTIEVLQGWLPTRDSGTTDIFTNTCGTWVGIVAYQLIESWIPRALSRAVIDDANHLNH